MADAKARLSELVSSAEKTHERTLITKNGRPVAAVISIEELESLEETLEVLSDPEALADLRESEITTACGLYHDDAEGTEMMKRRVSGNPMTEGEVEARMSERMGRDNYLRVRAAVREALLRDPDANVRERARLYV